MLIKPIFPVVDYIINYDYISTQLCENKAKPELKCKGTCHLKKELAKEAKKESPKSNNHKGNPTILEVLFFENLSDFTFHKLIQFKKRVYIQYNCIYFQTYCSSIFHPPILV